jgi:hypothetical protein
LAIILNTMRIPICLGINYPKPRTKALPRPRFFLNLHRTKST